MPVHDMPSFVVPKRKKEMAQMMKKKNKTKKDMSMSEELSEVFSKKKKGNPHY